MQPFKLTLHAQNQKGERICSRVFADKLTKLMVAKQLKTINYNRESVKLALDSPFAKQDLYEENNDSDATHEFPNVAMNKYCNF